MANDVQPVFENWTWQSRSDPLIAEAMRLAKQVAGQKEEREEPGDEVGQLHSKLLEYRSVEKERSAAGRDEMAIDADFKDGLQWNWEDAKVLQARGQTVVAFNRVMPHCEWLTGTERRARTDYKVLPRTADDVEGARGQTDVLKYVSDVNHIKFHRSRAFDDAITVGVGWLEDYANPDPTGEPLLSRYESWRNVWWDSASSELDLGDARYLFRERYVDLEVALAMYPEKAQLLRDSAEGYDPDKERTNGFYLGERLSDWEPEQQGRTLRGAIYSASAGMVRMGDRQRVLLIEFQYRTPAEVLLCTGQNSMRGTEFDPMNARQLQMVMARQMQIWKGMKLRMHLAVMTEKGMIFSGRSPYKHDSFTLTPIWCYRRSRDNQPYGVVRNQRGIQEDINKRFARALYRLSSNQIIADSNATEDWVELKEQALDPNGLIRKRPGSQVAFREDFQLAEADMKLMQTELLMFQESGGLTSENFGRETNAVSGRAVIARQQQGGIVNEKPFDNMRLAIQFQGEKQLSNIRQFYKAGDVIRLTDARGNPDWMTVTESMTSAMADFIVSEQDYRASMRQAMSEIIWDTLSKQPPEVAIQFFDLAIEMMDPPNKEDWVKRARKIAGVPDPDAQNDPEEVKKAQELERQQQEQQAMAREAAMLELEERKAKIENLQADTQKLLAETGGEAGNPDLYKELQRVSLKLADAQQEIASLELANRDKSTDLEIKRELGHEKIAADREAKIEAARIGALADAHATHVGAQTTRDVAKIDAQTDRHVAQVKATTDRAKAAAKPAAKTSSSSSSTKPAAPAGDPIAELAAQVATLSEQVKSANDKQVHVHVNVPKPDAPPPAPKPALPMLPVIGIPQAPKPKAKPKRRRRIKMKKQPDGTIVAETSDGKRLRLKKDSDGNIDVEPE